MNSLVPPVNLPSEAKIVDALKCLNMLGSYGRDVALCPSPCHFARLEDLYEENEKDVMKDVGPCFR